ncbi:ABC transporter permease [Cryptosporangium aurantiacum]|uniref:Transport permease protein n=1 Tax=Cryptosporangium aurantiacum TaxID=134849 RepID=A0A1M7RNB3_9ACTN|nr:ABC transporter permease [Cryptosporangium aurantiacum]SHN47680.1 ABC-2 type transport system permease protein [Cryptosporangium aurantiacum]
MSAATAVLSTETKLFTREPGTLFWILVFPSLLLVGFGLIPQYRQASSDLGGYRIIDFYVPSVVLVALITASLQSMPAAIVNYRERGILRRMRTTPARPAHLLIAQIALNASAAIVSAILCVAVGFLLYDVALPKQPLAYVVTLLTTAVAGLAIGSVITAMARTLKAATAIGLATFFPAMFTAGIYVPLHALPEGLRGTLELTPFGAAAQALSQAAAGDWPDLKHFVVLSVWAAIMMAIAARWFRWE